MRFIFVVLCSAGLVSCAATTGHDFTAANASQIRAGVTTTAQVQTLLGDPINRNRTADGKEMWQYDYTKADSDVGKKTAATMGLMVGTQVISAFVPGAGLLAAAPVAVGFGVSGSGSKTQTQSKMLTIAFERDVVRSCKLQIMSFTSTSSGMALLGNMSMSNSTNSQEFNCEDLGKASATAASQ